MAHFYGWLNGNRGTATRCGTKKSGITATIQSWRNRVTTTLRDREGEDVLYIEIPKGLEVHVNGKRRIFR